MTYMHAVETVDESLPVRQSLVEGEDLLVCHAVNGVSGQSHLHDTMAGKHAATLMRYLHVLQ